MAGPEADAVSPGHRDRWGLLFGWSRGYLEPILRKETEINKLAQNINAARNELLEAESNRIRREQDEIAAERDDLKGERSVLIADRDRLERRRSELNAIISGLKVAVAKATEGRGELFSILNSGDPINRLSNDYGWKVWSDNYWGHLGYYLIIEHPDVRSGEGIIVGRSFEIDALKRKSPDGWRDEVQRVIVGRRGGPVLALDYSYFALYEDETAPVGGIIYGPGGDDIEFYAPLSRWSEQLAVLFSDD